MISEYFFTDSNPTAWHLLGLHILCYFLYFFENTKKKTYMKLCNNNYLINVINNTSLKVFKIIIYNKYKLYNTNL